MEPMSEVDSRVMFTDPIQLALRSRVRCGPATQMCLAVSPRLAKMHVAVSLKNLRKA